MVKIDENIKYINPYNFITLPKKCKKNSNEYYDGNLTGYIDVSLTSKTPIFIPDTRNNDQEGLKHYKFFNYEEKINNFIKPVIPGSEIRGMLRSDFEVFTNSCMSTIDKDVSFISRTKDIKQAGILKKDKNNNWHLFKAIRYALHTNHNPNSEKKIKSNIDTVYEVYKDNIILINGTKYKTGSLVNFESIKIGPSNKVVSIVGKGDRGILFIGELGAQKDRFFQHDSIFVPCNENGELTISDLDYKDEIKTKDLNDEVKKLKDIYDMYNDKAFNKKLKNNWYKGYDFNSNLLPVWYSNPDKEGRVYLSLAQIGKEAYHRTISELVGDFLPCIDKNHICPTCNLFGFTSDSDSISSKIRISDALYDGTTNPYSNEIILKELAQPHIANANFYALYAPNTGFNNFPQTFDFNYDFVLKENEVKEKIDATDISIRGRKQYWHHKFNPSIATFNEEDLKRNPGIVKRTSAITPIKENVKFNFKIYFDKINKDTLDDLISIINLKYDKKDLCHKIGKGKPYGLGSCKLKVNNVYLKKITFENSLKYDVIDYNTYFNQDINNLSLKDFIYDSISMKEALRIYDFNYISKNYPNAIVSYPMGKKRNGVNSMNWFIINKSSSFQKPYVLMVLPRIIDGKDENSEGLKESDIIVNGEVIGTTEGLLLPKYIDE